MTVKDLNLDNAEITSTTFDVVLTSVNYRNTDRVLMSGTLETIRKRFAKLRADDEYKRKLFDGEYVSHFTYQVMKRITLRLSASDVVL